MNRFPHKSVYKKNELEISYSELKNSLTPYVSEERQNKIANVVENRTYNTTVVLDNIYDKGNVSAVMRSCENLGFGSMHIIKSKKTKVANRISTGADKWMDIQNYYDYEECLKDIRQKGYRLISTGLTGTSVPMTEVDWSIPSALVLGNEKDGVREEILRESDINCTIPAVGFCQSFNISVAAAILLNHIMYDRMGRLGYHGDLSEEEKAILCAEFYRRSCKTSDKILKNLYS